MYVSFTFVEETNAYVPSNCVLAAEAMRSAHLRQQPI
jgi:hypothetical protein